MVIAGCPCRLRCRPAHPGPRVPKEITVGTLYASQGAFAVSSMPQYQGLQFWADQVNKDGGVMVKAYNRKIPVKIVAYNDNSTTATASTLYNQLITQNKVHILVSDFGSVLTSVAVPIAKNNKMLLFDPTGTGSQLLHRGQSLPCADLAPLVGNLAHQPGELPAQREDRQDRRDLRLQRLRPVPGRDAEEHAGRGGGNAGLL